jgi:hypothetical protein
MRPAIVAIIALLAVGVVCAGEIRPFDLPTIELLGRQLYEHRNQDAKSLSASETRALRATKTALNSRIDNTYNFTVLHDPTKSGYLVYALATSKGASDVVFGIHYRVTVSADGNNVKQVDALSRSRLVVNKSSDTAALWTTHLVSTTPVETHVYLSFLHSKPIYVGTSNHAAWKIQDGRISKRRAEQ